MHCGRRMRYPPASRSSPQLPCSPWWYILCGRWEIQRKERVMIITLMTGGHVATSWHSIQDAHDTVTDGGWDIDDWNWSDVTCRICGYGSLPHRDCSLPQDSSWDLHTLCSCLQHSHQPDRGILLSHHCMHRSSQLHIYLKDTRQYRMLVAYFRNVTRGLRSRNIKRFLSLAFHPITLIWFDLLTRKWSPPLSSEPLESCQPVRSLWCFRATAGSQLHYRLDKVEKKIMDQNDKFDLETSVNTHEVFWSVNTSRKSSNLKDSQFSRRQPLL